MATTLITTHASLKTVIADWLNRSDLTDAIENFIQNAEARLRRDDRVRNMTSEIYTIVEDKQAVPKTFDKLESWWHDGSTYFGEIDIVQAGELGRLKSNYGASGVPQWAAIVDDEFHFAPEPDTGGAAAAGTLTFGSAPVATDTVVIGSITYTYIATPAAAYDVNVGGTKAASMANLVAAINDSGGGSAGTYHTDTVLHPDVYAVDNADGTVTVTAKRPGEAGNDIASTETGSTMTWGAATLASGVSPTIQYQTEIVFWEDLTALSAGSNWLVASHPDIYLYASLVESAPYLKDDQRLGIWEAELEARLEHLGKYIEDVEFGGSLNRSPVTVIGG